MRLLLDQGLPRSSASILREAGLDAVHVGEIGGSRWADADIIRKAEQDERIIVTLDADFHAMLALAEARFPSVIRLRIEGIRGEDVAKIVLRVVTACDEELQSGAMISVQEDRIRVRLLPLI